MTSRRARRLLPGLVLLLALAVAGPAAAGPTPPGGIGRVVVDADIEAPHAVVTRPDGTIYAAEFGVYTAADGTPARRRVWRYRPNGTGGYARTVVVGTADGRACGESLSGAQCGDGGPATSARLGRLSGLAVDAEGRIYLAESFWQRVRVVGTDGVIRTVPGVPGGLNVPEGLAYDASTNTVLVTDKRNHRLLSFPAGNATGSVAWTTVAGGGGQCGSPTAACGDGGPAAAAQLRLPGAVAADGRGTIYLADSGAFRIRRIQGGIITRFAGNGSTCSTGQGCGDGGRAVDASLGFEAGGEGPFGVATTPNGAVYIADSDIDRVRRVLPGGTIETIATVLHPKAPYALRTASGHDLVVPEWDARTVSRLTNVDTDDPPPATGGGIPGTPGAPPAPAPPPSPVPPGAGGGTPLPITPPGATSGDLRVTLAVAGSRSVRLGNAVRLRYTLSAPARLTLEVRRGGRRTQRISFGRRKAGRGVIRWSGRLHGRREAGRYRLVLVARDGARVGRARADARLRR